MKRVSLIGLRLCSLVVGLALSTSAAAQDAQELGDTGAPPPSAEDLGKVPEPAPPPAADAAPPADAGPAPTKRRKKKEPAADAATDGSAGSTGTTGTAPAVGSTPGSGTTGSSGKTGKGSKTAPAAPAPAVPAVAPEVEARVNKLKADLAKLAAAEPGDAKALEQAAQAVADEKAADLALKAAAKLAKARALTLQGRFDEASTALAESRGIIDDVTGREQRPLVAQVRYRQGELDEAKAAKAASSCDDLGLKKLAAADGRAARERVEQVAARYRTVVQTRDRFWGRRAAFKTASLYDAFYRRALKTPKSYRGVPLPNPIAVGKVDTRALVADVLGGPWPAEISRLYSEVMASIDAREPDDLLLKQVREKAAAFARLEIPPGESAENPWWPLEKPGLVRYARRYERRGPDGTWSPIDADTGKKALLAQLEQPRGSVEHSYALASLADAGAPPPLEMVLEAISDDDPKVELAGLIAAEKQPDPATLELLVVVASQEAKGQPFSTLQGSLFGTRERALLALRALANKDRASSEKILSDQRLPARERVWVVAELGDTRLQYSLQSLAWDKDPVVAATSLYALAVALGKNANGYMRAGDTGIVGCVSKMMQDGAR